MYGINAVGGAHGWLGQPPAWRSAAVRLVRLLRHPTLILAVALGIAIITRVVGLDLTVTADEGYWLQRTLRFGAAIDRGDLRSTFRKGHPGVTVMWTGLAGIGHDRARAMFADRYQWPYILERAPEYASLMASARLAIAIVTSVLITLVIALMWRLLGAGPALLSGGLLVFDPFVTGMTRLLHVDALLAPLMTVALLAALVHLRCRDARRYLVLSAIAAGLALLTKPPAVIVGLIFVALCATSAWLRPRPWRAVVVDIFLWGALVGATYVAFWPAMWVDPLGVLKDVAAFILTEGAQPHPGGVFFLGQSLNQDPGPFFYPIAFLLRFGLVPTIGVTCLLLLSRKDRQLSVVLALIGFALLFTVVMSFGAKKLDRYVLPALMVADLVAGIGILALVRLTGRATPIVMAGCLGVHLWFFVAAQPYPIAAYNALLGGEVAQRIVTVGWGEGLDQAVAYLNRRPRSNRLVIASNYHHVVRAGFRGTTHSLTRIPSQTKRIDYVILYVSTAQRGRLSSWAQHVIAAGPPSYIARVHGQDYAWVFRVPPDLEDPRSVLPNDEHEPDESDDEEP